MLKNSVSCCLRKLILLLPVLALTACLDNINPAGGSSSPNYPFYVTKAPMVVKHIAVPAGTKLVYEEAFMKEGEQQSAMHEDKLFQLQLPDDKPVMWGGMPTGMFMKYFNSQMRGMSVVPAYDSPIKAADTPFGQLWSQYCRELSVNLKDTSDWSFNVSNIRDIERCSANYRNDQSCFKYNPEEQDFLDALLSALQKEGASKP